MFGLKKISMDIEILSSQIQSMFTMLEELRQTNKEAIINRETITKFIDYLNAIVKQSSTNECKYVDITKKKPGRPKKL